MASSPPWIRLHSRDSVAIALRPLPAGALLRKGIETREPIPLAHKVALEAHARGEPVRRYGEVIGHATRDIAAGDLVHRHNLAFAALDADPASAIGQAVPEGLPALEGKTFRGYRRPDGRVGTRNHVALVATVNCSATVVREAARRARERLLPGHPGVDGIFAITHPRGCGIATGSPSHAMMNRVLAGHIDHPNVGARLVVGLGCEKGSAETLGAGRELVQLELPDEASSDAVPLALNIQDQGGTEATLRTILSHLERLLPVVSDQERTTCPASALVLGTQCGGSDGLSGVTANPAIGGVSDRLVAAGGRAVFAETTETFGASHLLVARTPDPAVAHRYLELLEGYREYLRSHGADVHANPAAGNHAGGITTLPEKALGSILKGGSTALRAVYDYAEPVDRPGLGFMNTPAFDPASCTALNAGGCTVGLFSTGRGSCYGSFPVPWIKISSNTPLHERLSRDMDFNAGVIADGDRTLDETADDLLDLLLRVASGERTWSERHGYGEDEFVLWDTGPMT